MVLNKIKMFNLLIHVNIIILRVIPRSALYKYSNVFYVRIVSTLIVFGFVLFFI